MRHYTIVLIPEADGGFSVFVPSLPGCVTQGQTVDECVAMAKDAITLWIESLEADGEPVPEESGQPTVIVASVAA